jgi:predicted CoA-binding protein
MDKILVLGASPNPTRFSYKATICLMYRNYDVVAVGFRTGFINGLKILTGKPHIESIHSILLYLGPLRQKEYYNYILSLKPKRIIFNPGTENMELVKLAEDKNIEVKISCALVMMENEIF